MHGGAAGEEVIRAISVSPCRSTDNASLHQLSSIWFHPPLPARGVRPAIGSFGWQPVLRLFEKPEVRWVDGVCVVVWEGSFRLWAFGHARPLLAAFIIYNYCINYKKRIWRKFQKWIVHRINPHSHLPLGQVAVDHCTVVICGSSLYVYVLFISFFRSLMCLHIVHLELNQAKTIQFAMDLSL